jgi:serine protease Do
LPKDRGEIVSRVEPGEGAAKAGLKQGDVVVRVAGKDVTPDQTLSYLVANLTPGSTAKLDVMRDGKPVSLNATIGTRPTEDQLAALNGGGDDDGLPDTDDEQSGQAAGANALGLQVVPLTPAIARSLQLEASVQGVVVAAVDPSSDAATKGLKRGDVIVSVNRVPTRTANDVASAIAAAKSAGRDQVLVFVQRPRGAGGFIPLKIKK